MTDHPYGRELVAVVRQIMRESDDRTVSFDARDWLSAFLLAPASALGGACPRDLLDDPEGRVQVRQLLLRMQSGAYS